MISFAVQGSSLPPQLIFSFVVGWYEGVRGEGVKDAWGGYLFVRVMWETAEKSTCLVSG